MPLARGAVSRAIMAWLPRRQLVPIIEANLADYAELGLGATTAEVLEAMRWVRRAGFAAAHGEVTPGVVGIAAPVFDGGTAPVGALCVTSAAGLMTPARIAELGQTIAARAGQLSTRLAAAPDHEPPPPAGEE
jgi:DNA-binding IclR family transcriptional regulator